MSKVLVDGATGSKELIAPLVALGIPAEKAHLDYGDIAFSGRGERGVKLWIGIEYKTVEEWAQSLCSTKRFQGHQLLGLVHPDSGFDRRYVLVEGFYHHDAQGRATTFKGKRPVPLRGPSSAVVFEMEEHNITTRGGCPVVTRAGRRDCLRWILACYRYWTDKDLDQHKSHLAMYAPDMDKGLLTPPSDFRKALSVMLPGIHLAVSAAVERYVGKDLGLKQQMLRVLNMSEAEWASLQIPNRNGSKVLGPNRAKSIMEAWK